METRYNPEIAEIIKAFLEEINWTFNFDEENGIFQFDMTISGMMKYVQYVVMVGKNDYTSYALSPIYADIENPEQMQRMAEFINRVNFGLKLGNFEMDFRDGEIRFKSFVNCEGIYPSKEVVLDSIYGPGTIIEDFSKGILNIIYTDMTALEALACCQ